MDSDSRVNTLKYWTFERKKLSIRLSDFAVWEKHFYDFSWIGIEVAFKGLPSVIQETYASFLNELLIIIFIKIYFTRARDN